jgi:serine phosphatase RsbU (regulator of sigma subunit)/anti-sigma regulatory factor (Ser/Thr protein kinase)
VTHQEIAGELFALPSGAPDLRLVVDRLPYAITLSTAVRDAAGRAVDMTLDYMNTAARAGQPDPGGALGRRCSDLWPEMVRNGSFAACMRVLDSGEPATGEFRWTEEDTYRPAGYDYHAIRVGPDTLLWVLRDSTAQMRRAALLAEASGLAGSTLEPQEILDAIAGLVVGELADWCGVHATGSGQAERVVLRRSAGDPDRGTDPVPDSDAVAARVRRTGRAVLTPVVLTTERCDDPAGGPGGALGVPLVSRGRTMGVLTMGRREGRAAFCHADLDLAADLASRAAVLLDHAQRFQREHRTAEVLQRSLLPTLPPLEEVEVAARYVPGGVDAEIGGDWYDVIDLGAGRIAVVIGDVMGRGVAAAAVMGQLRAAIRGYAQLELPPGQVLTLLDRLVDQLDGNQLVTCLYGIYDPATRCFDIANAGHLAPVFTVPGGGAAPAEVPPAPPLGSGVPEYEDHGEVLSPGTVVTFYTDGLVEVRGTDVDVRIDALCTVLTQLAEAPAEEMAEEVLRRMGRARRADDDTALLVLRTPADGRTVAPAPPVETDLPDELTAVRRARGLVRAAAASLGLSEDGLDVVTLVVSELVTNALLHGAAPVSLRVRSSSRRVYIEVADAARYRPHRRVAGVTDENGRGLELLQALSRRWGVRPQLAGKVVWAELGL